MSWFIQSLVNRSMWPWSVDNSSSKAVARSMICDALVLSGLLQQKCRCWFAYAANDAAW